MRSSTAAVYHSHGTCLRVNSTTPVQYATSMLGAFACFFCCLLLNELRGVFGIPEHISTCLLSRECLSICLSCAAAPISYSSNEYCIFMRIS